MGTECSSVHDLRGAHTLRKPCTGALLREKVSGDSAKPVHWSTVFREYVLPEERLSVNGFR